jgi:hypothetical protein
MCLQWELHTLSIILTTTTAFLSDLLDRIQFRRGIKVFVKVSSFNIVNKRNSLPTKQCSSKSGSSMYGHIFLLCQKPPCMSWLPRQKCQVHVTGWEALKLLLSTYYGVEMMSNDTSKLGAADLVVLCMTVFHRLGYSLSSAVLYRGAGPRTGSLQSRCEHFNNLQRAYANKGYVRTRFHKCRFD